MAKIQEQRQTPIEEIFSGNSSAPQYLTERALAFCKHYDIRTAEQLAGISKDSLIEMSAGHYIRAGERTAKYILGRMRRKGFPMSERKLKKIQSFEIIGERAMKAYILASMTGTPTSKRKVLFNAKWALRNSLDDHLFEDKKRDPAQPWSSDYYNSLYKDREFKDYKKHEISEFVEQAFSNPKAMRLFDELVKEGRALAKPQEQASQFLAYYVSERQKS